MSNTEKRDAITMFPGTIRRAFAIDWEVDPPGYETDEEGNSEAVYPDLPDSVFIPESVADEDIADFLSDKYGFLIRSYSVEEVDLPFDPTLPFPWATFEISNEDLERLEGLEEDEVISAKSEFFNSVLSDSDDEFRGLIFDYRNADASTRSAIDATLVRVCGWSLPTLLRMAEETAAHHEEFPREDQESVLDQMLAYLSDFSTFDAEETFGIKEDEDFSKWPALKLYDTLCEVGGYLRDLWEDDYTDSEIKEKYLDMGVPENSVYLEDFEFEEDE